MIEYDVFYPSKFIGKKTYCGFKHGKDYTLKVMDNKPYGVTITVLGDDDFECICPYCNLKSVERVWKISEK